MVKKLLAQFVAVVLVMVGACGGESKVTSNSASSSSHLAVFDETIPTSFSSMYEDLANNIDEISEDSHVIFLGRVVDYKEKLMEYHIDSIDWERYWIYDGIVMKADSALLCEMR